MNGVPLLSIVIPVYNVKDYLEECIESVLRQTYTNFEIILVNDGSTDESGAICDAYAEKDSRVHVFHKENEGVSVARNFGLLQSRGTYIAFLDSDDFYSHPAFFQQVHEAILKTPGVELIFFPIQKYFGEHFPVKGFSYQAKELCSINKPKHIFKKLVRKDLLFIYPSDKILLREFLLRNQLLFKRGMQNEEDADWCLRVFPLVKKMAFVEQPAYMYRQNRAGSATGTTTEEHLQNMHSVLQTYVEKFSKTEEGIEQVLLHYMAYRYTILCGALVKIPASSYKRELLKSLKAYKWLLNYHESGKVNKVYKIYRFFGITLTIKVLGLYIKYRR